MTLCLIVLMTLPPPPPFHHCYLGSFGPADCPIAAFKRGDKYVMAREGDIVDGCMIEEIHGDFVRIRTPEGRPATVSPDYPHRCADDERSREP